MDSAPSPDTAKGAATPALGAAALAAAPLAAAALALSGLFPVHNNDTFGHLAQGRQIAELGYVPSVDTFSFFRDAPQPWFNYEWGSDLLLWLLFDAAGPNALLALKLLLLAATGALLVVWAQLHGARLRGVEPRGFARRAGATAALLTLILCLVAIPGSRFRFTARPEVFGLFFSALLMLGLRALSLGTTPRRAQGLWIAALTLCHIAWVNLHGSHLLGLVLTAAHLLFVLRDPARRRPLALLLGLQLVASTISPFGPAILLDAVNHVAQPVYRALVREWAPWSDIDPLWYLLGPVLQTLLLAVCAIPLWRAGPSGRSALAIGAVLAVMSFRSIRFLGFFLVLSAPIVAWGLSLILDRLNARRLTLGLGVAAVLAAAAASLGSAQLPPHQPLGTGMDEAHLPTSAGHYLRARVDAPRILAPVQDAWYLMYAVPSARFLIDGRIPFYGAEHIYEVGAALGSVEELPRALDRFGVDTVVLNFTSSAHQIAVSTMQAHPNFRMVDIADRHALFLRVTSERQSILRDTAYHHLRPAFDPAFLLADTTEPVPIEAELVRLVDNPSAQAYAHFVAGILALRPLRRQQAVAGFRMPITAEDRARAAAGAVHLGRAADAYPLVPLVQLYFAQATLATCQLDSARDAIERGRIEGDNREALFTQLEVDLRSGQDPGAVRTVLDEAARVAEGDPWIAAIRADLEAGVSCR